MYRNESVLVTFETGTAYPFRAPEFTTDF